MESGNENQNNVASEHQADDDETLTSDEISRRRLNSDVWVDFDMLPLGPDKKQRCKCKKCGTTYACPSTYGTGNLHKHLLKCKRRDTRDIGQLLVTREHGSIALGTKTFDQDTFRELLNAAIVMHCQPYQFVEFEGFRAVFRYLNENVQTISRNTCKSDVHKLYNREKERLKYMLQSCPGRISLTSDLWSSMISDGYLSLTAHFLDKDWILQKRVLNYSIMPPPHTAVNLTDKIYSLLCEWGIEHKVFAVTLDNASANICFINLLISRMNIRNLLVSNGDYVHIKCCAHILNLVVQEGLKVIPNCLEHIRMSIKYLKGSSMRKMKFIECVNIMAIDLKKGLRQDCSTRWNSTFVMLDGALYYRRAFTHLALADSDYTFCPSPDEWDNAEKICKFLSVFFEITQLFSGSKYPTSNLYFPLVAIAHLTLKDKLNCEDEFISSMAGKMYEKFKKYWADFSTILAIACILDPRYKLSCVDFFYKKFYGADSYQFRELKSKLFLLFNGYSAKSSSSSASTSTQKQSDFNRCENLFANEAEDVMKELDEYELDESVLSARKTQLELYLEEPKVDRKANLDILAFWKGNQFRYPELSAMACDILSIPITTVASEAAFSVGGRVLNKYRTTLLPENAETLICARDWLYGEKATAELKIEEICEDILNLNLNMDGGSTS